MSDFSYERDGVKVTKRQVSEKTQMIRPEQPKIQTRPANDLYRENYDRVFGKKAAKPAPECACSDPASECTCGHEGEE